MRWLWLLPLLLTWARAEDEAFDAPAANRPSAAAKQRGAEDLDLMLRGLASPAEPRKPGAKTETRKKPRRHRKIKGGAP